MRNWVFLAIAFVRPPVHTLLMSTMATTPSTAGFSTASVSPEACLPVRPGEEVFVVGYDGSPGSMAALAEAADRCRSGGRVIVVGGLATGPWQRPAGNAPAAYGRAVTSLIAAVWSAFGGFDRASYELRVVTGDPSKAVGDIVRRHRGAELICGQGRQA